MLHSLLATVILLKKPVFDGKTCLDAGIKTGMNIDGGKVYTGLGRYLGEKNPKHPYGFTVLRIEKVERGGQLIGYVMTDADGDRYYGARAVPIPKSIAEQELQTLQLNYSATSYEGAPKISPAGLLSSLQIGSGMRIMIRKGVLPGSTITPCAAEDLTGHT